MLHILQIYVVYDLLKIFSYFSSNVSSKSFIRECSSALDIVEVDMSSFGNSAVT